VAAALTDGAVGSDDRSAAKPEPPPGPSQADRRSPPPPHPQGGDGNADQQDERRATAAAGADPETDTTSVAALKAIGSVLAQTTLLTALFFYFGTLYTVGYYRYFGVNFTVLDLPLQGVLILSASTAIVPLALLAIATLVALWLHQLPVQARPGRRPPLVRVSVIRAVTIISVALLGVVAADTLLAIRLYPEAFGEARGLSLALGVLGLSYAAHLRHCQQAHQASEETPQGRSPTTPQPRPGPPQTVAIAIWGSKFLLVSVGLFWAVGSYAVKVGTTDAQGFALDLACAADVTVYSEKSLNLSSAGVREEPAATTDIAYGFRYPGLKLIPQAGQQYLLIPADWAPSVRPAILLPRGETLRLEFTTSPQQLSNSC
jgi:hypothetical protein